MKKILHVTSSPRGIDSNSIQLGNYIVEKLQEQYPGSEVTTNHTAEKNYQHMPFSYTVAFKLPPDQHSPEQQQALLPSDEAIEQLQNADIVVISLPVYNFNLPSSLKAWLDHVVRPSKTISYKTGKPEGLLQNKKVYLAISSSGVYSDGPTKTWDFGEPYLRFILNFLGINDITTFRIEGLAVSGFLETAVKKGFESVDNELSVAV
jgi:FMN-dependent NADH-azoreductase